MKQTEDTDYFSIHYWKFRKSSVYLFKFLKEMYDYLIHQYFLVGICHYIGSHYLDLIIRKMQHMLKVPIPMRGKY